MYGEGGGKYVAAYPVRPLHGTYHAPVHHQMANHQRQTTGYKTVGICINLHRIDQILRSACIECLVPGFEVLVNCTTDLRVRATDP